MRKPRLSIYDSAHEWSFSKLETYHTCPRQFQMIYLENYPNGQNAYSEYGTLCHKILESYAKGELEIDQLADVYCMEYSSAVVHSFPPMPKNAAKTAYETGLRYFENFTGFGEKMEVVSAEEMFHITMGNNRFVGISDLVLRNKETGRYTVVDHKTKSVSSMKNSLKVFRNQLYLYSEHVFQKYGAYPEEIQFNMIKGDKPIIERFSEEGREQSICWLNDQVDLILMENEWRPCPQYFYCRYICPCLQDCDVGMGIC